MEIKSSAVRFVSPSICRMIFGPLLPDLRVSETSTTALFHEHHDAACSRCTAVILTALLSVDTIPFHSNVPDRLTCPVSASRRQTYKATLHLTLLTQPHFRQATVK